MHALIIGGSQFIGPYVINELLKNNNQITVFNRGLVKDAYSPVVTFIRGDRNEGFYIDQHFDVVIDMCAYHSAHTKRVLDELHFDFLVHISTAAVYQKTEIFPLREDSSPLGSWPLWGEYNQGKVACEQLLAKSGVPFASVRPVYILGPRNSVERERFIYSKLKEGEPLLLPGNGGALMQFSFVYDVAKLITWLANDKISGAFNCSSSEYITLRGLVKEMSNIMGVNYTLKFNPSADGDKFKEKEFPFANENFVCSNEKLKKLGFEFTPLLEGLKNDYKNYYSKLK